MPATPADPDATVSLPPVCVCGYDLAGLPPGAAAKCPECGVVVAEIVPPLPRLRHLGRLLAMGLTPAMLAGSLHVISALWPRATGQSALLLVLVIVFLISLLVSVAAICVLVARGIRARTLLGRLAAIAIGLLVAVFANWIVVGWFASRLVSVLPD